MAIPFTKEVPPLVLTGTDAGGTVLLFTEDTGICGYDCEDGIEDPEGVCDPEAELLSPEELVVFGVLLGVILDEPVEGTAGLVTAVCEPSPTLDTSDD